MGFITTLFSGMVLGSTMTFFVLAMCMMASYSDRVTRNYKCRRKEMIIVF